MNVRIIKLFTFLTFTQRADYIPLYNKHYAEKRISGSMWKGINMSRRIKFFLSLVLVFSLVSGALIVPGVTSAQGGGGQKPSASGGKSGSPGMGGSGSHAAPSGGGGGYSGGSAGGNAGSYSGSFSYQPSGSAQAPSFDSSNFTASTFSPQTSSGGYGERERYSSGGERPTPGSGGGGEAGSGGNGERPRPGGGDGQRPTPGAGGGAGEGFQARFETWGSSFSPFSQDESGQWSRFGERGSGSIALGEFNPEGALGWFDSGGFGSPVETEAPTQEGELAHGWHREDAPEGLPESPTPFENLENATGLQDQAQDAITNAGENRDQISDEAQDAIAQTAEAAQQAYDQLWADYYNAVDYTAQAYYDTITATYDYMLETYLYAVEYTAATVSYYLDYYYAYYDYCYWYPWDCYAYTYDTVTGAYYYTGYVSDYPVATVTIGDVTINGSWPAVSVDPVPSAEAYKAVTVFANDQLGAVVEPLYAGEATDQVQLATQALPDEIEAFMLAVMPQAAADYWALINGGFAGVAVGTSSRPVSMETLNAELSASSAGVYALYAEAAMPSDAAGALDLITKVYPALEGLAFAQISDVEGFAFTASAAGIGSDPVTGATLSVAKVIYAGVVSVNGKTAVYTLVGVGQPYVDVISGAQIPA
jgi:hypothetical protein